MGKDHASVKPMQRAALARATGCNLETIRYYESVGVMPEPPRDPNGYRSYGEDHLRRLRFVMRARDLGFSLEEIRGLLSLVDSHNQTCAEVKEIASAHLHDVQAKIADLQRIEKALRDTVAQCSGADVPECPVLDALLD
ncbi:MAG: MerR family transcriptional regulator [Limimaricola soesokkakensis]|uniref:MerR family transcriptional regulator n=1 Tax=Limimaricola soesokkakensis TaxID=1343159 RepID=UPI0040586D1E